MLSICHKKPYKKVTMNIETHKCCNIFIISDFSSDHCNADSL